MVEDESSRLLIHALVLVLVLAPAVPIGMSWVVLARTPTEAPGRRVHLALLAVLTLSQLLLVAGLLRGEVLGPDYSPRRYTTIYVNLVAMVIATVVAARTDSRVRRELFTAAASLTCAWVYVAAVSSVV